MNIENYRFTKTIKDNICPLCNKKIKGHPALSRIDNKTKICSKCGMLQALEDFIKYKKGELKMFFKQGEIRPYLSTEYVRYGKILKVNEEEETYTIEDLETKEICIIDEDDVFIGDDWKNTIFLNFGEVRIWN